MPRARTAARFWSTRCVLHRRPGQQAGKAGAALPEGHPGPRKTQALPRPGEPGIDGAPVAAGKFEHQVEAPPAQVAGEPQRLAPGFSPPVHHHQVVQPRVPGHHVFGALGDQVGEMAVRPGLFERGDYRGGNQHVPGLLQLDDQEALRSHRPAGPAGGPWPRPVWRRG